MEVQFSLNILPSSPDLLYQDNVLTVTPAKKISLAGNGGSCNVSVTFSPTARVQSFSEEVSWHTSLQNVMDYEKDRFSNVLCVTFCGILPHYIVYTVCTVQYRMHRTVLYAPYSTVCTVQYCMHRTVPYAPYSAVCTVQYRMHRTVPYAPYSTVCTVQYRMHRTVPYAPYSTVCTVQYRMHRTVLYAPYSTVCTVQCRMHRTVPYAPYSTVCTVQYRMHRTVLYALYNTSLSKNAIQSLFSSPSPSPCPPCPQPQVILESSGIAQPLFLMAGSCHGMEIALDSDHVPFGAVVLQSRCTRRVLMYNRGDIGSR